MNTLTVVYAGQYGAASALTTVWIEALKGLPQVYLSSKIKAIHPLQ
ncbi:MAG: hypothetical protein U1E91_05650 [Moraxella sp.]